MTFLGWKLSTGEVVKGYEVDTGETRWDAKLQDNVPIMRFVSVAQHQAHLYREFTGYKGRMTPQYAR